MAKQLKREDVLPKRLLVKMKKMQKLVDDVHKSLAALETALDEFHSKKNK